jgi:hypothetical protein
MKGQGTVRISESEMCGVSAAVLCRQVIVVGRDPKAVPATYVITLFGPRDELLAKSYSTVARDAVERSMEVGAERMCEINNEQPSSERTQRG